MVTDNETIKKIRELKKAGYTYRYICYKVGCRKNTVWKYTRDIRTKERLWTKNEIEVLFRLKKEGKSFDEISERIGRTYASVLTKYVRVKNTFKTSPEAHRG